MSLISIIAAAGVSIAFALTPLHEDMQPPVWKIDAVPRTVIDERIGVHGEFAAVADGVLLADGRIAVLDRQAREVRTFDSDGRHIWTEGRSGSGPREFQDPYVLGSSADTLFIYDLALRRITALELNDASMSMRQLSFPGSGIPYPLLQLSDGSIVFVLLPASSMRRKDGLLRYSTSVWILPPGDGGQVISVGKFPWLTSLALNPTDSERAISVGTYPFGPQLHVVSSGNALVIGDGADNRLRYYSHLGERLGTVDLPLVPRAFDAKVVTRVGKAVASSMRSERAQMVARARHDPKYLPEYEPFFAALLSGPDGEVWIERFRVDPSDESEYLVTSASGRVVAKVESPGGLRVLDIGRDAILAVATDVDDVERIVVHHYRR